MKRHIKENQIQNLRKVVLATSKEVLKENPSPALLSYMVAEMSVYIELSGHRKKFYDFRKYLHEQEKDIENE